MQSLFCVVTESSCYKVPRWVQYRAPWLGMMAVPAAEAKEMKRALKRVVVIYIARSG